MHKDVFVLDQFDKQMMNSPIAIIGMACRFPGKVNSPDDYWQLLLNRTDAITEIPADRFGTEFYQHPSKREPGKSYTFSAGVIEDISGFDAAFFGISPREAEQMDPQQRLLLELAWEAFEDADYAPQSMAGRNCAVYVGIASHDYGDRSLDDLSAIDPYSATGNTGSIASNRISYVFDLRGPSMSVDTACSSSLVALHQACQALTSGDTEMALAGGVNLLLHPFPFISFAKASMLSPTGRCRTFDASGDGYVRSEGGALLLLKPLHKALADGDTIHAVIAGSGVNSDGHSKGGINVPATATQAALIQSVMARAGVTPEQIDYVEAHGTGTAVGDPIETKALINVIGQHRQEDRPLLIGSAKSNIGHLETASGMAGLIKAVLCLKHRAVPPSIHFTTPNPKIDFNGGKLKVVTELTPFAERDSPLITAINSFGFGGTNAHVLLQEFKPTSMAGQPTTSSTSPLPLMLSARSKEALHAMAGACSHLLQSTASWNELASNMAHRRQLLTHRALIHTDSEHHAIEALEALARGGDAPGLVQGMSHSNKPKMALVFSGNGSQWAGMGKVLLQEDEVFRLAIEEVDTYWQHDGSASLASVMRNGASVEWLQATENSQPLLFAIQVGIVRVLQHRNIQYQACYGHSVGEVAAAWAAGALPLKEAVRVIKIRSRAQGQTRGVGRMAAVGLSKEDILFQLEQLQLHHSIEIAGVNSPSAVTIAGPLTDLEKLGSNLKQRGHFFQLLDLDYAFHSTAMEPIQSLVTNGLANLQTSQNSCLLVSTVTGTTLTGHALDAAYWWKNIRQPVLFDAATSYLVQSGFELFLEIGPHSILRSYVVSSLSHHKVNGHALATLKRNHDSKITLQHALDQAVANGASLDIAATYPPVVKRLPLPLYPWQRQTYWLAPTSESYGLARRVRQHPLLGYRLTESPFAWENHIDPLKMPALGDHVVDGAVIFPGAAYAEMALAAAQCYFNSNQCAVENLEILSPAVFQPGVSKIFRFAVDTSDGRFSIESKNRQSTEPWQKHASGRLIESAASLSNESDDLLKQLLSQPSLSGDALYQQAKQLGLQFGPTFRGIQQLHLADEYALAILAPSSDLLPVLDAYVMHPALIDSGFHPLLGLLADQTTQNAAYLPVQMGTIRYQSVGLVKSVIARIIKRSPHSVLASFTYLDQSNRVIACFEACRFRKVALVNQQASQPDSFTFIAEPAPYKHERSASSLPPAHALMEQAIPLVNRKYDKEMRQRHLTETMPLLDVLAAAYALQAVRELGLLDADDTNIEYAQPHLLSRLVSMLVEDGVLREQEGRLTLGDESLPEIDDLWRTLLASSPEHIAELALMSHCGQALAAVIRGDIDGEQVVDPNRSGLLEHFQYASPTWEYSLERLKQILLQATAGWQPSTRLRILEVRGKDAHLDWPLGANLPAARCEYVIAGSENERNMVDMTAYPHIRSATIKYENGLLLQQQAGLPEQYDIVVLNNALRDGNDVADCMLAARQWLTPAGMLLVLEAGCGRFADIVFGMQHDWPQIKAQISPQALNLHLQAVGFTEVDSFPESEWWLEGSPTLLAARRPDVKAALNGDRKPSHWILLSPPESSHPWLTSLQDALQAVGDSVSSLTLASNQPVRLPIHAGNEHNVVFLTPNEPVEDIDGAGMLATQANATLLLAELLPDWAEQLQDSGRLWMITSGGAPVQIPEAGTSYWKPNQAAVWGLGRVIMNEYPQLNGHLIDIHPDCNMPGEMLAKELLAGDKEEEVLLTPHGRYVPRMMTTEAAAARQSLPTEHDRQQASVLSFEAPGSLRNLRWMPLPDKALQPHEVEITPSAVGLNFRDVMYAMGLLSDEAVENGFAGPTIGMELSGYVTRVGSDVRDFKQGDAVLGFAPAAYASLVRTSASALTHKPDHFSFEAAATIPATFFTAYYALCVLANLREGERILIHGGAGGVGLAAIQIAQHIGAEIFATAGSDEKREVLRLLGVQHILDSRSLVFADQIMMLTGGEGVDVVLNSLAGEAMIRSVGTLRPFGRFLELGKRDFYENSRLGLRPFRNNISYFGIDADQLMQARPDLTCRVFAEVMQLLQQGVLQPLPYRAFPAQQIEEAFRYMQQAKQIGKILVTFPDGAPAPQIQAQRDDLHLDPQATYVVAGGTSGLGFATARWMVTKGARKLVLISRSGKLADEALHAEVQRWQDNQNIVVITERCDITDMDAVSALFSRLAEAKHTIKGIVHSAMVIADGLIANQDSKKFQQALAPKIAGAWNLHCASRLLPLDFFVVYSSATTLLGNPGQANYVAGNTFLESLVGLRRSLGLPACYMAWGPLDDVGFLARNTDTKEAIQSRIGGSSISSAQAMSALERVLLDGTAGEALLWLDWEAIQRVMPAAKAQRYLELQLQMGSSHRRKGNDDLRSQLLLVEHDAAIELVENALQGEIARILHLSRDKIQLNTPVISMGMDSLMGMELGLSVEESFGVKLPVMVLAEGASIHMLAERITDSIMNAQATTDDVDVRRQQADDLARRHAIDLPETETAVPTASPYSGMKTE